jgi:hypothetical protein
LGLKERLGCCVATIKILDTTVDTSLLLLHVLALERNSASYQVMKTAHY